MRFFSYWVMIMLLLSINLQANWQIAGDALKAEIAYEGHFGYSVDVGQKFAVVGAPDYHYTGTGGVYIFKKEDNGTWSQMQVFHGNSAGLSSYRIDLSNLVLYGVGVSVAIAENLDLHSSNPDFIVIGAPDSTIATGDPWVTYKVGAICVLEYNASTELWQEQGQCIYGDTIAGDDHSFGYSVDISSWTRGFPGINGMTYLSSAKIIVGDPDIDGTYENEGAVTFFDYNASAHEWNEVSVARKVGLYPDDNIHFGYSVAIDKTTAIIGAPGIALSHSTLQGGKVYFYYANGIYITELELMHTIIGGDHHFGISVDIEGDYAIAGEEHLSGSPSAGAAYIIKKTDSGWNIDTTLQGSTVDSGNDGYGKSVAINRDHAIVGAPTYGYIDTHSGEYVYTGAVFIYDNAARESATVIEDDSWSESARFYGNNHSFFGLSLGLYDDYLMVGAHGDELVQPYRYTETVANPAIIMYLLN